MKTTTKISDTNKEFDKTKIKSQQDTKIFKKPKGTRANYSPFTPNKKGISTKLQSLQLHTLYDQTRKILHNIWNTEKY